MDNKTIIRGHDLHDETLTELIKQLGADSAILVREEMALVKQEIREKIQALRTGALMMCIGLVLSFLACATLWAAFVIWLTAYWPPDLVAAVTGGGLALIGLIITLAGRMLVRKTTVLPVKSVEALEGRTENG